MTKAIFLDRDGTINEEVNYLRNIKDIRIFPGTTEALQKFKFLGYINIIVTNQSGIARGFLTEEELNIIHNKFRNILTSENQELIDDIFYSPFHKDGVIKKYISDSPDRKPGVGMILKAKQKHNIDISQSFFIGDSTSDMKCAENAGLKKILVKTGYGKDTLRECIEENIFIDYLAEDLFDASGFIERNSKNNQS